MSTQDWEQVEKLRDVEEGQECMVLWPAPDILITGKLLFDKRPGNITDIKKNRIVVKLKSGYVLPFKKDSVFVKRKGFSVMI